MSLIDWHALGAFVLVRLDREEGEHAVHWTRWYDLETGEASEMHEAFIGRQVHLRAAVEGMHGERIRWGHFRRLVLETAQQWQADPDFDPAWRL